LASDNLQSTLFSSMLEVQWNSPVAFKYGHGVFARKDTLCGLEDRTVCRYLSTSFDGAVTSSDKNLTFYGIHGCPGADQVFMVRKLPFGEATISLSGLRLGVPSVSFNSGYKFWSNLRFSKVFRPARHLGAVAEAGLLQRGVIPVHGGSVIQDGYAHLLLAPPDTGKSTSVMGLVRAGFKYAAEDMILVKGTQVYPVPFTATVSNPPVKWSERIRRPTTRNSHKRTIYDEIGLAYEPLAPTYKLGNLYLLVRSSRCAATAVVDRTKIMRKLIMWNRMELLYHQDRMLMALLALNDDLPSLDDLIAEERVGLQRMIEAASEVIIVEASEPAEFSPLILSTLK